MILPEEINELVRHLATQSGTDHCNHALSGFKLATKQQGYRLNTSDTDNAHRKIGKQVAHEMWWDRDGKTVFAALHSDTKGRLYELDIWRIDFNAPVNLSGWKNKKRVSIFAA